MLTMMMLMTMMMHWASDLQDGIRVSKCECHQQTSKGLSESNNDGQKAPALEEHVRLRVGGGLQLLAE
jgi:hypothetical protein